MFEEEPLRLDPKDIESRGVYRYGESGDIVSRIGILLIHLFH